MSALMFAAVALGLTIYSLVLGIVWITIWVCVRRGAVMRPLRPVWKWLAAGPLLLWPVLLVMALPNLGDAGQRGRAKKSMADIRSIATALEAWAVDQGAYPAAGSLDELAPLLEGKYIAALPRKDQWGNPYRYHLLGDPPVDRQEYWIISAGSDGTVEWADPRSYPEGATTDCACDIVYYNDHFRRYPEGRSR